MSQVIYLSDIQAHLLNSKESVDPALTESYLRFVHLSSILSYFDTKTNEAHFENHHILPQKQFPEFKKFKINEWNKHRTSYLGHICCHFYLAQIYRGEYRSCYYLMTNQRRLTSLLPNQEMADEYAIAREEFKLASSKRSYEYLIGSFSVTNGVDTKFVKNESDIPEGWYIGTSPLRNKQISESAAGKRPIVNIETGEARLLLKDEELPEGWKIGHKESQGRGISAYRSGGSWWHDPQTLKSHYVGVGQEPSEGLVRGRKPNPNS